MKQEIPIFTEVFTVLENLSSKRKYILKGWGERDLQLCNMQIILASSVKRTLYCI